MSTPKRSAVRQISNVAPPQQAALRVVLQPGQTAVDPGLDVVDRVGTVPIGGHGDIQASDGALNSNTATVNLTVTAGTSTMDFTPTDDTTVTSKYPTTNYGDSASLEIRSQSKETIHSYLKFNVTGVNGTITSARLRVYVDKSADSGGSVYAVSNNFLNIPTSWTETGLVWGNAPSLEGPSLSTVGAVTSGAWVKFDVTAAIQGDGVYNFGLGTASNNRATYRSKEAAENHPVLIIEFVSDAQAFRFDTTRGQRLNRPRVV